jgi:hypothetical protein
LHCTWNRDRVGTGYWFRAKHEVLLLGVRGQIPAPAPGRRSTFTTAEIHPAVIESPRRCPRALHTRFAPLRSVETPRQGSCCQALPSSPTLTVITAPAGILDLALVFMKRTVYVLLTAGLLSPIKAVHGFNPKGDRNLIASISALSMTQVPLFAPSASKPHYKPAKRE